MTPPPRVPAPRRDGLLTVTHADNSRLLSHSRALTSHLDPLHALALCASDPGVCAAAYRDGFVVLATPWEAADAPTLARYSCPDAGPQLRSVDEQVGGRAGGT